jgi:hypothetical protein
VKQNTCTGIIVPEAAQSAEVVDLAAERILLDQAITAAARLEEFREGEIPFQQVIAALIAPFNDAGFETSTTGADESTPPLQAHVEAATSD